MTHRTTGGTRPPGHGPAHRRTPVHHGPAHRGGGAMKKAGRRTSRNWIERQLLLWERTLDFRV